MDVNILESEAERHPLDFESVSKSELEVFGLIPELCPALHVAYGRYMRMVGRHACANEFEERQKRKDKAEFRSMLKDEGGWHPAQDANLCALWMNHQLGIPFDQAYAWHRKVEAQQWRQAIKPVHGVTVSDAYRARMNDAATPPEMASVRHAGARAMTGPESAER